MALVKSAVGKLSVETRDIGMSKEEIEVLRWHGAKATLSSVMQHLNLPKRVVRWQGNWKSQAETMPDTYLRESQVISCVWTERRMQTGALEPWRRASCWSGPHQGRQGLPGRLLQGWQDTS